MWNFITNYLNTALVVVTNNWTELVTATAGLVLVAGVSELLLRAFGYSLKPTLARILKTTGLVLKWPIGIAALIGWILLWWLAITTLHPAATYTVGPMTAAFAIFLLILPLIPKGVEFFANDPNRFADSVTGADHAAGKYPVYDFGFFTLLAPERAKIIERGERFITVIMRLDNHTFRGEVESGIRRNEQEYWDVILTPPGHLDFHPIPDRGFLSWINPFWWWKRYVYHITGAVFTGIPPFQKVRTYQMTRLEKIPLEEGKGFRLVPKTDWSDHYRVADDQMFVEVANADTKDKLPVDVQQAVTLRVKNPYMTAYNTGRNWAIRAMTALTDAINTFTRKRTSDEVISIKEGSDERGFSKAVMSQANRKGTKTTGVPVLSRFGVEAIDVALLKNDLDPETQKKLQDEAIAAADARARELRGRGEAAATGHVMDAVIKRGEKGAEVFMAEARIRQAKAAGESGGTVILDGGSGRGTIDSSIAFLHDSIKEGKAS